MLSVYKITVSKNGNVSSRPFSWVNLMSSSQLLMSSTKADWELLSTGATPEKLIKAHCWKRSIYRLAIIGETGDPMCCAGCFVWGDTCEQGTYMVMVPLSSRTNLWILSTKSWVFLTWCGDCLTRELRSLAAHFARLYVTDPILLTMGLTGIGSGLWILGRP